MTPAVMHLIESTGLAVLTAILLFVFRVRKPAVRHAAWMLAALKFSLPASLFVSVGAGMRALAPQPGPVAWSGPVTLLAGVSTMAAPAPVSNHLMETVLLGLWLAGAIFALGVWLSRLGRALQSVPATAAESTLLQRLRVQAGVSRGVSLRHFQEPDAAPGLTGIFTPVICIPATLQSELAPVEFESVLLHELAHVRRWDNLSSAAVHAIACVFWFHPLLWWMERKIAFEAERACDDLVVGWGAAPGSYADAILKVCHLQIAVPLAGVSGIGSNLRERMEWILSGRIGQRGSKLGGVAVAMLVAAMTVAPLGLGFIARPVLAMQNPVQSREASVPVTMPQWTAPASAPRALQRAKPKPAPAVTVVATQAPEPEPVRCAYMSVWYPEGTVGWMHSDRMCIADADGSPRWEPVETAGRPQVGETVDLWAVRQLPEGLPVCRVRGSRSASQCSCEAGPVALGTVVTSDRGESLVCDKWSTRATAEWRPVVPGKDN